MKTLAKPLSFAGQQHIFTKVQVLAADVIDAASLTLSLLLRNVKLQGECDRLLAEYDLMTKSADEATKLYTAAQHEVQKLQRQLAACQPTIARKVRR